MTTFRSKIDTWLGAALGTAIILQFGVAGYVLQLNPRGLWAIAVMLLASAGFILWILLHTVYRLNDDSLLVRSGPFSICIPLTSINGVKPTRNPLSSPALSLDRLEINYGPGKCCMISPLDKSAFLAELRRRGVSAA